MTEEAINPHPVNEDPEAQPVGQQLQDPWADDGKEWPSVESQIEDEKDHVEKSDVE
jgi:hypothetical protein